MTHNTNEQSMITCGDHPFTPQKFDEYCLDCWKANYSVLQATLKEKEEEYTKCCSGRAYLDEKLMKADAELSKLREAVRVKDEALKEAISTFDSHAEFVRSSGLIKPIRVINEMREALSLGHGEAK